VDFLEFERRLVDHIRELVRCGELTERRLARMTGISQPHIHNVLRRKRSLSIDSADLILHVLHLDLVDLLDPGDVERIFRRDS
jgi:transcriptional regulator with XRE-family HTH domain